MDNSHPFELVSRFKPTGDQPQAIDALVKGLQEGKREQVLEGATGMAWYRDLSAKVLK